MNTLTTASDEREVADRRATAQDFRFRNIHPHLHLGTASDRFAGWIGQVYPESYRASIDSKKRRVGGLSIVEQSIPVDSVHHYFERFDVLELDYTFYKPLKDAEGVTLNTLELLKAYADHAPDDASFLLKAPQVFFARKLRRSQNGQAQFVDNPTFLDAEAFDRQFLTPARETLGRRLRGVIFEQEYQRAKDGPTPEQNLHELSTFFSRLPRDVPFHIELRSPYLLTPSYFDWLEQHGIGFVFSHWTWLPPIRQQWKLCEGRFTAADGNIVVRLLNPLEMKFEEAFILTHPFEAPAPELVDARQTRDMILDVTALVYKAQEQGVTVNAIASNHAYGNAPALCQAIAYRVLDEEERRRDR